RRRAITCSPLRAARATRPSRAAGSRARRLDELVEDRALDPDEATVDAAAYARQAHDLDDVALDPGADRPVAHAEVGGGFLERQEPRGSGFAIHSTTWIAALHADARGHLACTWPGIRLDQVGAHGASPVLFELHASAAPHVVQWSSPVRTRPPHSPGQAYS